ncbi:transporter substrate-binding domain-containing protein [Lachnospiraceae bacterium NSJ-143]|nr:transporter substrate-binding domain-containing protein [Lachnospiraceae bacterium NSJ-143]
MKNKSLLILSVVLMLFSFRVSSVFAAPINNHRIVSVAYPIQAGLTDFDEYGNYTGYTYEYLQEISQYTGWDYDFVQMPYDDINESLTKLLEKVENGEIDIIGGILYYDSLNEKFDYTANGYGTVETVLQVLENSPVESIVNYQSPEEIKVAVIKGASRSISELEEYCKKNFISPVYVYCDDIENQVEALKNGEADVMLNSSLNYVEGLRNVGNFSPKTFYFVTAKGKNHDIMEQLDSSIAEIERTDKYFGDSLLAKYFSYSGEKTLFNQRELKYIATAKPLNVGVLTDNPPYQFKDSTGELKGISINMLDYISKKTGLKFKYIEAESQEELYAMEQNGDIDMIAALTYDYGLAQNRGISMTRPFLSSQYTMMRRNPSLEDIAGKRLALLDGGIYKGDYAGEVINFDTVNECIRAVNDGRADYTYVDGYVAQYFLNKPEFSNLNLIPQTYGERRVCFGVYKPGSRELLSILNKAITGMSMEEKQSIIYNNTVYNPELSFMYYVKKNPLETVAAVVGILAFIIVFLLYNLHHRAKINKEMALNIKKHLQVYELLNDYFFEYEYSKKTLMISFPAMEGKSGGIKRYDFSKLSASDFLNQRKELFLKIILSGESGVREELFEYPEREKHWIRFAFQRIYDDEGKTAYIIGKINNIDNEKLELIRLKEQAQKDSLTKIYNAAASRSLISESLDCMEYGEKGAILLIDIDNFKQINDTYGHLAGDETLGKVVDILLSGFRKDDIIGRPGGDEFVVYMKKIGDLDILRKKCLSICENVRTIYINGERQVTVSIGVSVSEPGCSYEDLYKKADMALYKAKDNGRNRFEIA